MKDWKSLGKNISPKRLVAIRQAKKREKTKTQKDVERLMSDLGKVRKTLQKNPHDSESRRKAGSFLIICDELLMRPEVINDTNTYDKLSRVREAISSYIIHYDEMSQLRKSSIQDQESSTEEQKNGNGE